MLSYDTGCLIWIISKNNGFELPNWDREKAAAPDDLEAAAVPGLDAEFDRYFGEMDKKLKDILARGEKLDISGKNLLLWDPYNVRSSGNRLYHPNFIMCGDSEPQVIMGTFVTVMKEQTRELESVYKVRP